MFWTPNHAPKPTIDLLFKNGEPNLVEILDDGSAAHECRGYNARLIDYLVQDSVIDKLVEYVSSEPDPQLALQIRYKYPHLACELLTCDADAINDALLREDVRLDRLCQFLRSEPPLNPLTACFCSKILQLLVRRRPDRLLPHLCGRADLAECLVRHVATAAVSDLLLTLASVRAGNCAADDPEAFVNCDANGNADLNGESDANNWQGSADSAVQPAAGDWLADTDLVQRLIDRVCGFNRDVEDDGDAASASFAAAQCTEALLQQCRGDLTAGQCGFIVGSVAQPPPRRSRLLHQLESAEIAERLMAGAIPDGDSLNFNKRPDGQAAFTAACQVAMSLLTPPSEAGPTALVSLCAAMRPRMAQLSALLKPPADAKAVGSGLLHLLRLMRTLAACGGPGLFIVAETEAVPASLRLMLQFPWCSFLHQAAEQLCLCSLAYPQGLSQPEADARRELQRQLIVHRGKQQQQSIADDFDSVEGASPADPDCRLPSVLLAAAEANRLAQLGGSGRRGYMGHVIRLANCLNACLAVTPINNSTASEAAGEPQTLVSLFNQLEPHLRERWSAWCQTELAETNARSSVPPASSIIGQDDDDNDDAVDNDCGEFNFASPPSPHRAMQTAYVEFQARQLANSMPEQFGFQEDEFNEAYDRCPAADMPEDVAQHLMDFSMPTPENAEQAAMFDRACNSRIRPYEDHQDEPERSDDSGHDSSSPDDDDDGASDAKCEQSVVAKQPPANLDGHCYSDSENAAVSSMTNGNLDCEVGAFAAVNGQGIGAAFPEIDGADPLAE